MGEIPLAARGNGASQSQQCGASGWRLRISSADSNRDSTCPLCGQRVPSRPDIIGGRTVWVIKEHRRLGNPDR
jgi:hypothetical protein